MLSDKGYTANTPLIRVRQENSPHGITASLESKTKFAIVSMFRRRVLAGGTTAKRFAVEPVPGLPSTYIYGEVR